MIESTRVDRWLHTTLSASAPLVALVSSRIYGYVAPQGTTGNMVIYNHQGSADVSAVGGYRVLVSGLWLVKAVTQSNSFTSAEAIVDLIDTAIHRDTGSTSDALILACVRQSIIQYVEVVNGIQYRHLGALYRIQVQED